MRAVAAGHRLLKRGYGSNVAVPTAGAYYYFAFTGHAAVNGAGYRL
jgi:hypothetical protein